ncbi:MAG: hypothetical protein JXA61_08905 [Bacteroidales bacterium]|nr:hypothetical protein [Bacteroidales bacterium]
MTKYAYKFHFIHGMIQEIDIDDCLGTDLPIIDVRSPGEYKKGHIPGAVSIPLFTDIERARLGAVYTKQSAEKAVEMAHRYVKPRLSDFLTESRRIAFNGKTVVHCWRGGMRSRTFAEHLADNGFTEIFVIQGGY